MGETWIFTFVFTDTNNRKKEYQFPAHSLQMAWIAAASYVGCHIGNPAVESIQFVKQIKAVSPEIVSKLVAHPDW